MTGTWSCPQYGCTRPLAEHVVSLAARNPRPPEPKKEKKR